MVYNSAAFKYPCIYIHFWEGGQNTNRWCTTIYFLSFRNRGMGLFLLVFESNWSNIRGQRTSFWKNIFQYNFFFFCLTTIVQKEEHCFFCETLQIYCCLKLRTRTVISRTLNSLQSVEKNFKSYDYVDFFFV